MFGKVKAVCYGVEGTRMRVHAAGRSLTFDLQGTSPTDLPKKFENWRQGAGIKVKVSTAQ